MYNQRTEYHREVNRDDEPKQSWKSWFGLGDNKDRDEDRDRGYNYQSTTTYRNPTSYGGYERERYSERNGTTGQYNSGYAGTRGGYGYTSSDEVARPSWNTDRDYHTRQSYGQPTGDRDTYYKESRTYGGDRDFHTPSRNTYGGDHPSRSYGFSGETTTGRDYPTSRDYGYSSTTTRDYPTSSSRDYQTGGRYPMTGDSQSYGPSSRGYGFERDTNSRNYPDTGRTYGGYESSRREYTTSGGYGGNDSYTRPAYQSTSYRY